MYSHACVGISDFDRALAFYTPLMSALGLPERFTEPEVPWAGWQPPGSVRPLFFITRPYDGGPAGSGIGAMLASSAADRDTVDAAHAAALALGGRCEGPPGLRPHYHAHYHAHYYGAYFRDPDGSKLCVAWHAPANDASPEAAP